MPLWKVYHPAGAYSAQDKKEFVEKIAAMYSRVPILKFYVVMIFDPSATLTAIGPRNVRRLSTCLRFRTMTG
jgi:Putative oxalocrotonate tautomerase enzyme